MLGTHSIQKIMQEEKFSQIKKKKKERGKVRGRKYTNNYTAEPHPTLIQTNNERRDSQKGKKYQDTENKDYKNTRG